MRKTLLLLTMLFSVVGGLSVSAQTHYKPGERKSTFAVDDLVFIYNTNRNGDRTGFLKKNGNSLELVKEKPYAGSSNLHYDKAAGASVWKIASVETGVSNQAGTNINIVKLSIKPASADTYLKFDGTSNNAEVQYLYLQEWRTATFSRDTNHHEKISGESVAYTAIETSDKVWVVGNSDTPDSYWNGTAGGFTTWGNGHGYAFYTAVDASTEYRALLNAAKAELNATIEEATTNYNSIAVSFNPATSVNLTADGNLFSNAEQTKTGTGDARAYLSNLTDGNANTFFHSSYEQTKASFPNEYHYLQVNLDQAADVIGFSYTTRNLDGGPHPTVIEVQCSSDGLNFVSAATLTKDANFLPTTAGANYFSRQIGLPFSSRYIRYVVKKNHRDALTDNGYPYFTMAKFGMQIFTFADNSTSKEPLDVEWYGVYGPAIYAAQGVYEDEDYSHMLVSDVNAANAALAKVTAAYERYLANKSNPLYTKDPVSPVLFAIKSGRSGTNNHPGNWYYVFKPVEGGKIKIESIAETAYEENLYCYWYLMLDALTGYCRLYPYAETSKPMGYITVGDGEDKLTNVSTTTNYVGDLYELVSTSDDNFPYALKPAGKSTYVSNYNGKNAYMGFYNVLDNGTKFATVSVTALENIESLRTLHEAYKATPTSRPADSKFGITLNKLNEEYKRVYDEAYPSAGSILTTAAKTTTAENLATTTTKVESLPSLFHMNQPATGKFYRFKSVKHSDKRLRSNVSNGVLQCGDVNDNGRESIFYLTADNKLVAYVEGQYIGWNKDALANVGHAGYVTAFGCGIDYASYTIATVNGGNKRYIYCGGTTWDRGNTPDNSGYDWVIEEVPWLPVGVNTTAGYGTLYSPVALGQTNGVDTRRIQAYTGAVADGVLKLTPIEGTIPQNTPVIFQYLTGEENGKVFLQVMGDVADADYANNGTEGYLAGQFVTTAKDANASIYTLQNGSKGIGMYKYSGANIQGFRAYLPYTAPAEGGALRMVFDDVTTGIEGIEVNDGGKTAIYDLSGRRVSRMTKGLYIVNGKKVFIK
ncbi:MAG: discoidin domain-containing protein [Alloprevotella sp.]|nr:discoidin domain-containing protein [Bacteroidales bacterium]MDY5769496.1 discoidin domain-containing protein [Alloprevotella sp.]